MSAEALGEYVFVSKHARRVPDESRRETWEEAVDRVMDMHLSHVTETLSVSGMEEDIEFCRAAMYERLALGSQRALQFGGAPIMEKHARLCNCTASYADGPRFFQEALWLLLCGCGVGFSVQHQHVAKLPSLRIPQGQAQLHTVRDAIEGWADAIGILLASYNVVAPEWESWRGILVEMDYSQIRPEGSLVSSSDRKAPGSNPLRVCIEQVRGVLERCAITNEGSKLRPIDAYDIVMHSCNTVLAGGIRRSATICLFSQDDEDMMKAKTGNWFAENPQRARSNNSAVLFRVSTERAQFLSMFKHAKQFGEPGFIWSDDPDLVYNPCVEVGLHPQTGGGSGWAFCNLCEINGRACVSPSIWKKACYAATVLGTMQAAYTIFPYLGNVSERIAKREALLGASITGIMDRPELLLNPTAQREMALYVKQINAKISAKLGIRPAARTTCIKPAGTSSCLLGTSSGIHPHHSKRYFRHVQASGNELPVQHFASINPCHVQPSAWSSTKSDEVITFCIETSSKAMTKTNVNAIQLLHHVRSTQENWVDTGRNVNLCAMKFVRHNVSNTIHVRETEWEEVADYIFSNRDTFAGVAMLSNEGDRDYPQAPFVEALTGLEIQAKYGKESCVAANKLIDGLSQAFNGDLWSACDACLHQTAHPVVNGPTTTCSENNDKKELWAQRVRAIADRHFRKNVKELTYCLKDIYHWNRWQLLQSTYREVDWKQMHAVVDDDWNGMITLEFACSGGTCEMQLHKKRS